MIPKVIHYCWFSNERKSPLILNCIKSWKRILPEYEIKCWGPNSFDFQSVPYVSEAYSRRKWAFVSDYVRLYALLNEGGIYLDSDVEVIKPFDKFLDSNFFSALEPCDVFPGITAQIEPAIMGSQKSHPFIQECLNKYANRRFINDDGGNNYYGIPLIMTEVALNYGFSGVDCEQHIPEFGISFYPTNQFTFAESVNTAFARHHYNGGWLDRGLLYKFCKGYGFLRLYQSLEKTINFLGLRRLK